MVPTENLRRQHKQIVELAGRLAALLENNGAASNAYEIRSVLSTLAGVLSVHLAMEDGVIYPKLLHHSQDAVRRVARRYVDEMGNLKQVFSAYVQKWRSPEAIRAEPTAFATETNAVFAALALRIERENSELYVLVDQNGIPAAPTLAR